MKKSIAIIGASGGLGKKVSEQLLASGQYDIIGCNSKACDITKIADCVRFFNTYPCDIVLNFAGVNYNGFIHKLNYDVQKMVDVNILGAINLAATCLPKMRERGYGRIIFISSVLATHEVLGTGVYSSCKAFVDRFVKSISAENIGKGVTANSIQLGYFDGGMTHKLPEPEKIKKSIGLNRWGAIEELYRTIEYIIATEYFTGANLQLNGGL